MDVINLHILSTYLKKWSYHDNRISLSFSFFSEVGYFRSMVDMRINSPQIMVNEFLNNVIYKAREAISQTVEDIKSINVKFINEAETQRKMHMFLGKILKEFNANKRSRGRVRMISNRSMDFYYNDFEYDPLDDKSKFYVHLNRGLNKMNGDLWSAAIDDLELALKFDESSPLANKYLAKALMKSNRLDEALPYFKNYAENETSLESLNELAHAFMKLELYEDGTKIFKKMKVIDPEDLLAKVGEAQIVYLQGKKFISYLDKIYKIDEDWLREYLKKSWEYKLPGYEEDETKMWNAATAARYLGYDRPFDLTKRAFNDEVPCYFDSERCTIRFVKAELDNWVEINNRYKVYGSEYKVYEDRLNEKEIKIGKARRRKKISKKLTDMEADIIA